MNLSGDESENSNHPVPSFVDNTFDMISNCPKHIASWSEKGDTFIVYKPDCFAKEVIPQYFRHNNFSSFIRQLHIYGFQKIKVDRITTGGIDPRSWFEFKHEKFIRNQKHLIKELRRKQITTTCRPMSSGSSESLDFLKDEIHSLKEEMKKIRSTVLRLESTINKSQLISDDNKKKRGRKSMKRKAADENEDFLLSKFNASTCKYFSTPNLKTDLLDNTKTKKWDAMLEELDVACLEESKFLDYSCGLNPSYPDSFDLSIDPLHLTSSSFINDIDNLELPQLQLKSKILQDCFDGLPSSLPAKLGQKLVLSIVNRIKNGIALNCPNETAEAIAEDLRDGIVACKKESPPVSSTLEISKIIDDLPHTIEQNLWEYTTISGEVVPPEMVSYLVPKIQLALKTQTKLTCVS